MPQKKSALILPISLARPSSAHVEMAGQYLARSDLPDERKATSADLVQLLGSLRRSDVICLGASLLEAVSRGCDSRTQLELIDTMLEPHLAGKIKIAIQGMSKWAVFHRRQIWLMLQMAFIACSEETSAADPKVLLQQVGKALMMTSDLLHDVEAGQISSPEKDEGLKWLINLLVSHAESPITHDILARAHCLWFESLTDPKVRLAFDRLNLGADYEELFRRKYGISLREFFFIAAIYYFTFLKSAAKRPISSCLFDATIDSGSWSAEDKKATLGLLATSADKMAARLLGVPRQSWALDYSPLLEFPLLEVFPGRYACPDLSHFRRFFLDGIFWLLDDAAATPEWRKFFGVVYDWYISRLIGCFGVTSPVLAQTFFRSPKFRGTEDEVCDGLLVWQKVAVLGEYKSNRFTSRQRSGSAIDETIRAIEETAGEKGAVGQLAKSMGRILSGEAVVAGASAIDLSYCQMLVPALIWYEETAGNHAVRNHLQEQLEKRLNALNVDVSRVGPLILLTTSEVEMWEELARSVSAEELIHEYVQLVKRLPRDPASVFQAFAHIKFHGQKRPTGFMAEKVESVITGIQTEHSRRSKAENEHP